MDGYYYGTEFGECGNFYAMAGWFCKASFYIPLGGHGLNVFGSFSFGSPTKLYVDPVAGTMPIMWSSFSGERQPLGFTNAAWTASGDDIYDPGTNLVGQVQNGSGESMVINGLNTATDIIHTGLSILDPTTLATTSAMRGRTSMDLIWLRPYSLGWYVPDTNTVVLRNISNELYRLNSTSTNVVFTLPSLPTNSPSTGNALRFDGSNYYWGN